jgi:hypothetical protein
MPSTTFWNGITAISSTDESGIYMGHNGTVGAIGTTYGSSGSFTPLIFQTSEAERMRITSGGNVLIGTTTDNGSRLQINGTFKNLGTYSAYNQISVVTTTPTTLYTISIYGLHIFYVDLPAGSGSPALYSCYAIISFDGASARILQQTNGTNISLTLSGNNLQVTQTSGGTYNVRYIAQVISL